MLDIVGKGEYRVKREEWELVVTNRLNEEMNGWQSLELSIA